MPTIDAGIYNALGVRPKSTTDYLSDYNALDLQKQRLQQNALGLQQDQAKLDDYQRGLRDQNALRSAVAGLPQSATAEDRINALERTGLPAGFTQADTLRKTLIEQSKGKAAASKDQAEAMSKLLGVQGDLATRVMAMPTKEAAMAALQQGKAYAAQLGFGNIDTSADEQILSQLQTPEQIKQWAAGHALKAKDLLPTIQTRNTGGTTDTLAVDPITGKPAVTSSIRNTISPDRAAEISVQRERLAFDKQQPKGVVVQTDQGPVLADPRTGATQPLVGAGGEPLGKPLKDIPASVNTAIIANTQNLNKAKAALSLLQGKNIGEMTGDPAATGYKGVLPGAILNRMDPKGVDTRAAIADLGSMVLHDRSGAAVTASEYPRLQPFIPTATDDADTAAKKLKRFIQVYEQESQALGETYSKDQGYKPNPVNARQNSAKPADAAPAAKTVVRTGTHNGKKVVQYSDGSVDYAN
jgi:hypothetical protein